VVVILRLVEKKYMGRGEPEQFALGIAFGCCTRLSTSAK